jgi:hypothetical protein
MNEQVKRLRDLPGVAQIEGWCKVPSYFDDLNIRATMDEIDRVSISLFCLSYYETGYDLYDWEGDVDPPSRDQWETWLWNSMRPYSESQPFWEALGWDITDGKGQELDCAHYFTKQIIIAESGWIEGIGLTLDGSGKEPVHANAAEELSEEELTERLEREVQAFLLRRR